ncbi:MAG: CBS domain-containing protein, partial [Planctomycetota bacterium]|nr:CBS domain-containing protein [Planctomycetota bacterium]
LSILETSVGEVMQREVVTVEPADSIVSALADFLRQGIGCLPVVEDEQLLGILTEFDLLELYRRCARDGVEEDPTVGSVILGKALTVAPDIPFSDLVELCEVNGFRHLPVVEGGELVGMLSERDLRRATCVGAEEHTTAAELMTAKPLTTHRDEALSEAAGRMLEYRISALPVLGGEALGILTAFDVLDHGLAAIREQAAS